MMRGRIKEEVSVQELETAIAGMVANVPSHYTIHLPSLLGPRKGPGANFVKYAFCV